MRADVTDRTGISLACRTLGAMLLGATCAAHATENQPPTLLSLEATIPLGDIKGRIDHLAVDVARHRLYVAELGNDSVGVIDLESSKLIRTLTGLREPQGIAYVSTTDMVYVANAGDGSVRVFQGQNLAPAGQIALGSDADNIRVSQDGSHIFVGYGDGALAIIDSKTRAKVGEIPLKAHPESFRLETDGSRIFVNVPDAHAISVIDSSSQKPIANWSTGDLKGNFPLVLDGSGHALAVFRHPARIGVFDTQNGSLLSSVDTCGDSDDVFIDAKRSRLYVICGEGFVDTYSQDQQHLFRVGRMATAGGARTGLFVTETDRLYVAARAGSGRPAEVWVLKPGSLLTTTRPHSQSAQEMQKRPPRTDELNQRIELIRGDVKAHDASVRLTLRLPDGTVIPGQGVRSNSHFEGE